MQSHDEPNVKFCHYFNNSKKCPFKEFGCKFRHTKSDQCKYQENCKNKLCQYRHQKDPSTWRCTELNWEGELCRFETTFEVRFLQSNSIQKFNLATVELYPSGTYFVKFQEKMKIRRTNTGQARSPFRTLSV